MVLPAGAYHVLLLSEADPLKGAPRVQEVKVEAGRTVQLELIWRDESSDVPLVRGLVLEPDGAPSPFARVMLSGSATSGGYALSTDEEGRFGHNVYHPSEFKLLTVTARNGGRSGETRHALQEGEQEVVVRLRPGASVRGRVVRADGQPVRGFTVGVQGRPTREFSGDRFELSDVPAEPVTLVVRTVDGAMGTAPLSPVVGTTAEVEVSVAPGSGVGGRVVDAATNAPLAGATVLLKGQAGYSAETAVDGRFVLKDLSPGEGTLEIYPYGSGGRGEHRVTLVRGQTLDVGDVPVRQSPGDDSPR